MRLNGSLTEASGDMDKAAEILRKRNKAIQDKKGERETAEGRIAAFIDLGKQVGALVEMRCESAPVVKSEHFVQLANDIARQIALQNPPTVEALLAQPSVDNPKHTVHERIGDVVGLIRENMKVARFTRLTGLLGSYCHHDGSVGVLLQVEGAKADPQLLRDICMHITAKNPVAARREDVPATLIEKEKEIGEHRRENCRGQAQDLVCRKRARRAAVRQGRYQDGRRPPQGSRTEGGSLRPL